MSPIFCCLCSRRADTRKQRVRVGTDSNWPMLKIHAEKNGLDMATFSKDDYVCIKCHSTISHYRMKDRGPNKNIKNSKPIVFEPGITKDVLRGNGNSSMKSTTVSSTEVVGGIFALMC